MLARSELTTEKIEAVVPIADGSVRRAVTLAESGAAEVIGAIGTLLQAAEWSPAVAARITDAATARGADTVFREVADAIVATLRDGARGAGRAGASGFAARAATAAATVERELAVREAYGVDRALSLRSALLEAHRATAGRLAKGEGRG